MVQLERARERLRRIGRAVLLARVHGVSFVSCGLLCLPLALFDASAGWLALVFSCAGAGELHGARLVRALDPRGPRWLCLQQLIVLGAIAVYCAFAIRAGLAQDAISTQLAAAHPDLASLLDSGALASGDAAQIHDLAGTVDSVYRVAVVAFYGLVLGVATVYQGACAWFHASRGRLLSAHASETPRWVAEVQGRVLGW